MSEKTAFLFPGQASQFVGMAKDLAAEYSVAGQTFDITNELLGFDIGKICFEGPAEELTKTSITQPAILIHSVIVARILKDHFELTPDMVAGHSLGEYSALVAAEALTFEDALRLVKLRGELMHQAGVENPGTMAAIIGLPPEVVAEICREISEVIASDVLMGDELVVVPANFNSPEQTVISGTVGAVEQVMALAKERGAKIAKRISVGGAFHSPLMASAREGLRAALEATRFNHAKCQVFVNVTGLAEQDAGALRLALDRQLTSPVQWLASVQNMISAGSKRFYEVGPGNVLAGLQKRIDRRHPATTLGTVAELQKLKEE